MAGRARWVSWPIRWRFSRPVRFSSTAAYCPARPMAARTSPACRTTSRPSTLACPASGSRTVARIRTAVVLPAPFGPSRPSTLPASAARSMPSSATTWPNRLTSPCAAIAGSAMAGQGPRQPEQGQHAVVEPGQGPDPAVVGYWRQRRSDDDIVGEQGDYRVNVPGLVGPRETFDDLPFDGRAGHRGRICTRWKPPVQVRARMLERAGDRILRRVEHARDLPGAEPENVAQDQDRPLPGRQELQGGDEGERDRLSRLIPRLRARRRFGELLQQHVGIRLEPNHLAGGGRLRQPGRGRGRHGGPPPRRPQGAEATVGGDPKQPRPHRRPCLKASDAMPGG